MRIEIVVHVSDRPHFLSRCLRSVIEANTDYGMPLFASYNGSCKEVRSKVTNICESLGVRLRLSNAASAYQHFRESSNRCTEDYVILLHDDDYVQPQFIGLIADLIHSHPGASAYSVEPAFNVRGEMHGPRWRNSSPFRLSPLILSLLYLLGRCGPAFPSICYSTEFVRGCFEGPPRFGKYFDTSIVAEAAREGLWMSHIVAFTYVMHSSNDSFIPDLEQRRSLRRHLLKELLVNALRPSSYIFSLQNLRMLLGRYVKTTIPNPNE